MNTGPVKQKLMVVVVVVMMMVVFGVVVRVLSCIRVGVLCAVLEVYQFARDAAVAESWLLAHEPYLQSQDYGVSIWLQWIE